MRFMIASSDQLQEPREDLTSTSSPTDVQIYLKLFGMVEQRETWLYNSSPTKIVFVFKNPL